MTMKTYNQERAEKLLKRAAAQFEPGSPEFKNAADNYAVALEPEKAAPAAPPTTAKKRHKRKKKKACK
jgi:hypothetical protein